MQKVTFLVGLRFKVSQNACRRIELWPKIRLIWPYKTREPSKIANIAHVSRRHIPTTADISCGGGTMVVIGNGFVMVETVLLLALGSIVRPDGGVTIVLSRRRRIRLRLDR